ncbi:hypothetical protein DFS34DRAFT_596976 [Phlyctochytrium arcticum]|nr:hypothetical protein DFS34DRAFT_596976 [Phlyctochytrium arcticum]
MGEHEAKSNQVAGFIKSYPVLTGCESKRMTDKYDKLLATYKVHSTSSIRVVIRIVMKVSQAIRDKCGGTGGEGFVSTLNKTTMSEQVYNSLAAYASKSVDAEGGTEGTDPASDDE